MGENRSKSPIVKERFKAGEPQLDSEEELRSKMRLAMIREEMIQEASKPLYLKRYE